MKTPALTFAVIAIILAFCTSLRAQGAAPAITGADAKATPMASKATGEIADAAKKFLAKLDEAQRAKVAYGFKDDEQRKRWSNLPTSFVKRAGLRMGDLTPPQRDAAMAVVAAALSAQGYEKVLQIMGGDETLKKNDRGGRGGQPGGGPGGPGLGGSGRGGPGSGGPGGATFGRDEYYISFLGLPSASAPWMIQFGGHHLAINITLVGEQGTLAPSHTAAQPAVYEIEGKTVRPLGRETEKGFALFSSLDEAQRKQAVIGAEMHDLVLGPGRDG